MKRAEEIPGCGIMTGFPPHHKDREAGHPAETSRFRGWGEADFCGLAGGYSTKAAAPGTYVSKYHEGGRPCSPAFPHIWAISTFTNGVQFMLANQLAYFSVLFPRR